MRIICKVKNLHAIRLKRGDRFLTPLTKSVFEAEAGIYYTIKENLRLYCNTLSAFVIVFIA